VKNPVLPNGASSKEKATLAIHLRSSEQGILAFSREKPSDANASKEFFLIMNQEERSRNNS
jgi:hypothetical protein